MIIIPADHNHALRELGKMLGNRFKIQQESICRGSPAELLDFLMHHPEVIGQIGQCVDKIDQMFPGAQLSIALSIDPENGYEQVRIDASCRSTFDEIRLALESLVRWQVAEKVGLILLIVGIDQE